MKKEISFKEFLESKETQDAKWLCVYNLKEEYIYKFFYGKRNYFIVNLPLGAPCSPNDDRFIHNRISNTVYRVKEANDVDYTYIGFKFDYTLPLLDLNIGRLVAINSWHYDIMISKGIDLEHYYHNWKKVTDYERTEVLKWLATNDFGYKIALISKQYY